MKDKFAVQRVETVLDKAPMIHSWVENDFVHVTSRTDLDWPHTLKFAGSRKKIMVAV